MQDLMNLLAELISLLELPENIIVWIISILNFVLLLFKTSKKRIKNVVKVDPVNTADYVAVVDGREIKVDDLHIKKVTN